jgi:hypothetical protein
MPIKCAFCAKLANSGEHIWSAWICDLPPFKKIQGRFSEQMAPHLPHREWPTKRLDRTKPTVCEKCNTTWMSDIENKHAKPCMKDMILSDNPLELGLSCITSVPIFAFLKSVINDHAPKDQKPFFSSAVRKEFRRSLSLPRIQVWVGSLSPSISHHAICRMKYGFWHPHAKIGIRYRAYAFTWGVGRFFLQMLALKSKSARFRTASVPFVIQDQYWDQFAIPIWPANGKTVHWPPPKYLDDALLNEFTNRFAP